LFLAVVIALFSVLNTPFSLVLKLNHPQHIVIKYMGYKSSQTYLLTVETCHTLISAPRLGRLMVNGPGMAGQYSNGFGLMQNYHINNNKLKKTNS